MLLNFYIYWEASAGDMLARDLRNLVSCLHVTLLSPLRFQMKPLPVAWYHVPVCNIRNVVFFFIKRFSGCSQMVKADLSINLFTEEVPVILAFAIRVDGSKKFPSPHCRFWQNIILNPGKFNLNEIAFLGEGLRTMWSYVFRTSSTM